MKDENLITSNSNEFDEIHEEYKTVKYFMPLWVIAMFGTAIGAGVLFLPIRAGQGGVYPIILMLLVSMPMVYFGHRGFARFVNSSKEIKTGPDVADESFGVTGGTIVSAIYIFILYPVALTYGLAITNTVDSFIINQLKIDYIPKIVVAIVLITLIMYVLAKKRVFMLRVTNIVTYPLIAILFIFSLSLIAEWKMEQFDLKNIPSFSDFGLYVILTMPILVYSFNHFPIIAPFVMDLRKLNNDPKVVESKINTGFFYSAIIITCFALFFAMSCTLTLTQEQLFEARDQNISVLSYFANNTKSVLIEFLGPLIAFTAIFSSFFAHYLAAQEGFSNIIFKQAKSLDKVKDEKMVNRYIMIFVYISMLIVVIWNPSILSLIENMGAPFMIIILLIMPLYATLKIPSLKKYASTPSSIYIWIFAIIALSVALSRPLLDLLHSI